MKKTIAELNEIIEASPEEFARLAVNALKTIGYKPDMHDKHDNKLIYYDAFDETYGAESWHCVYQVILLWTELEKAIDLTIQVREKNYGEDHLDICIDRVDEISRAIKKTLERAKSLRPKAQPYKAKFAQIEDLNTNDYVVFDDRALPENISTKFILGKQKNQLLALTDRIAHRHVLVCGPTGSGKSMSVFIPNLVNRVKTSAIVTEAVSGNGKPVLYGNTAGWRAKAGQEIIYFNPADLTSSRINPIDQVKTFDDAQHLAHLIVTNTTSESHVGDQVWSQSETHLLQSLLLHAASLRKDIHDASQVGDNANLGYLRYLLTKGPQGMEAELSNTRLHIARREFMAYLNCTSPNFRFGVISGLMMRLNLFVDPKVVALTEVTDFSVEELKNKLFTVYLATPVHKPEYTPLAVLMFNFCISLVLQDLDEFKYPMTILADEFTNFGYLPQMPKYMTVIRNAGIGMAIGIQDPVQLERVYREKDARILFGQPRTKIFFAPADDLVAVRLSKMLGTKTETEDVSASGQLSNREIPRPLMDASEIMQLEREQKYICSTATETIKLEPIKPWERYKEAISCPPPERPIITVKENLYGEINGPSSSRNNVRLPEYNRPQKRTQAGLGSPETLIDDRDLDGEEENYWEKLGRMSMHDP